MDEPEKEPRTPPEPENRFTTVPTPGAFSELESETLTELENKPEKEPRSFPPPWLMCALGICLILTGIALSARSEGGQSQAAGLRQAPELSLRPSPPPRLEKRLRQGAFTPPADAVEETSFVPDVEEGEFQVVRTKKFPIKPMTVDEAILQMDLLGHSFYAFKDEDGGVFAVVYKRNDGGYGLIEDEA